MRLAILSDIHGNPRALDAVLADIQRQGEVDAYGVLGDFAALGYDPVTPLETITTLPCASFPRGNTDRYVAMEDLPVPPEKVLGDPALLPEVIEATRSFSWTRGYRAPEGAPGERSRRERLGVSPTLPQLCEMAPETPAALRVSCQSAARVVKASAACPL